MVLEATNLLRMVLQNLDSVLLVRNLKSYKRKGPLANVEKVECGQCAYTYSHEKMVIKILGLGVLLAFLRNSSSLVQIDTLYTIVVVNKIRSKTLSVSIDDPRSKARSSGTPHLRNNTHTILSCA